MVAVASTVLHRRQQNVDEVRQLSLYHDGSVFRVCEEIQSASTYRMFQQLAAGDEAHMKFHFLLEIEKLRQEGYAVLGECGPTVA